MKPLLTIAPPNPEFSREALRAPGGFVWWYTDMVDAHGNGLVLIWSFGLPFLPGYASAARRGHAQRPLERPSLNVAVIRDGELACYLLHEFEPHQAQWNGSSWMFGRNKFETWEKDGRRVLQVELDCPLPAHQRLEGTVRVEGVARRAHDSDAVALHHDWAPMTGPATTTVNLRAGGERYEMRGRGYFDGNVGDRPLQDTGIHSWTWGRVPREDREAIYYVLWRDGRASPEATGVEIDDDGVLRQFPLDVAVAEHGRSRVGLRFPRRLTLARGGHPWLRVTADRLLDDGPFYLRYLIDTDQGAGIGEYCRTERIDLARHRALVRMRVQRADGRNSVWLPLFTGPRVGRVQRLFTQFMER